MHVALSLPSVDHRPLEHGLGILVLPQKMQDPSVGVKVGGVVRLLFNRLLAHGVGLLQALAFESEVVGVVVESRAVIGIGFQYLFVICESFFLITHLIVHVPDIRQGGNSHGGVSGGSLR